MAKLDSKPYPGDWEIDIYNLGCTDKLFQDILDKQPASTAKSLVGAIVSFPVADGKAIYVVVKDKPLTVQHIPFGDAWQADRCTLKGLDAERVREELRFGEAWKKLVVNKRKTS